MVIKPKEAAITDYYGVSYIYSYIYTTITFSNMLAQKYAIMAITQLLNLAWKSI